MSEKFVFENARVKHMEVKLLTPQSVQRLLDCADEQALFKALADMGFGAGAQMGDFDAMFAAEERKQIAFLNEFNVAGALDPFLLQYDFLSLKLILKALATSKTPEDMGLEGKYSFDELLAQAQQEDVEKLTGEIGGAIADVRALQAAGKATPRAIDVAVDKRMFAAQLARSKAGGKLVKQHFERKIDFVNLNAFLRCKKLGLDGKFFAEGFVQGGRLDGLKDLYDAPQDKLYDYLKGSYLFDSFKKAYESGNITLFETEADDASLKEVRKERDDMFGVAPILSYYLCRAAEIKVAKLIVAGVTNGVDEALIRERLRNVGA